jgi:hypothetical protein
VRGRVAPGSGAQKGVGSPSRRLFRAAPAGTPPPYLAAAAAPKGEGTRPPSRRPPPKHLQGRRRGPKTPYKRRYREAEEIFFGRWVFNIGRWVFKDLGVGCSTTDFGRWVFNIGRWVFKDLGVGCSTTDFGRWVRWMPLARALGVFGGPREATARWEHEYRTRSSTRAPAGSSRPREVDGGGAGHLGSGSVWSVCWYR